MAINLHPGVITEIAEDLAKELQEEVDWEVMMDIMKEVGYTHITMPWPNRMNEIQAHAIKEWCRDNLKENYQGRGKDWLFKNEKDASMFVLRWI